MDMTINRLPARTWEHLGMNESVIRDIKAERRCEPQLEGANGAVPGTDGFVDWDSIETGLGADMGKLTDAVKLDYFRSPAGEESNQPVTYRLHYRESGAYANCVRISAEPGSSADYIFVTEQEPGAAGLSALQIKAEVAADAHLRLYLVESLEHSFDALHDIGIRLAENAGAEVVQVILVGGRVYTGGHFDLTGQHSDITARIGYLGTQGSHLDMNYVARHRGLGTTSRMESSGVLRDNAFKLFRGTIDFLQGSSGAKGDETEDVLLIGDDVVNQTIPLILCAEEDVEGNHGATIGQLDEAELFYLASRGIGAEEAERLIARARLEAVITRIPSEQVRREALERL